MNTIYYNLKYKELIEIYYTYIILNTTEFDIITASKIAYNIEILEKSLNNFNRKKRKIIENFSKKDTNKKIITEKDNITPVFDNKRNKRKASYRNYLLNNEIVTIKLVKIDIKCLQKVSFPVNKMRILLRYNLIEF